MRSCSRRIHIQEISPFLDRLEGYQLAGNRCCTNLRRSISYEWSWTRDTAFVMSTVSKGAISERRTKGAIDERGTSRTEEL